MNMNSLVRCFGTSLGGFFKFCEKQQKQMKADDLNNLFKQYFAIESDDSDDEDTSKEAPKEAKKVKKASPPKARKPSGKGKEAKPRDEQTPVANLDLNKKKLPELKEYARERGLPVSGTKAQLIENIHEYENKNPEADKLYSVEEEENLGIQIKKPKTKNKKMFEPADKPKYDVEEMHGIKMIYNNKLDGWFVLNDKEDIVVGWVHSDDEANAEEDESVNIRALDKKICEIVKELELDFEVPENLDA